MISFCLCTIVWASSSSLLELCFMLFGFVGLNLMWRVLKDCLLKLNGGNHFHLTENCVSSSDLDDYAAYCVCWVACVFELYVCSLVRCAYFLHFSPSKKCGCSCVFIFFFPAEDEQRRGLLLCVRKMCFPLPILCTPTLLIPFYCWSKASKSSLDTECFWLERLSFNTEAHVSLSVNVGLRLTVHSGSICPAVMGVFIKKKQL